MRAIILILFLHCFGTCISQALPDFDAIPLLNASDFQKAESSVTQATTYILSTPFNKDDINRLKSLQFIIKWMSGTPEYMFTLDDITAKVTKGNDDLLGIYMACMTKYCLENKASSKDQNAIKLNSIKLLLAYCEDPGNNIKMTKQLKRLSEANQKGELEKEL